MAALILLAALTLSQGEGAPSLAGRARLEVRADEERPFVGEVVGIRVRVTLDARLLEENLVQSFRKQLGLPVQVRLPWWPELEGVRSIEPTPSVDGVAFVLNGQLAEATAVEGAAADERAFELSLPLLVQHAGPLVLEAGTLSFEHAEEFRESFLDGRVPVNPRRGEVAGNGLQLVVQELPRVGRPGDFHGAVGAFSVRSELRGSDATVGEPFAWTLFIEDLTEPGSNLFDIAPPVFEELGDFHVRGRIDRDVPGGRSFEFELVPLRVLEELPAVTLHSFDPDSGTYRGARTEALALNVAPSPEGLESIAPAVSNAPRVVEPEETAAAEPVLPTREGLGPLMSADLPSWPVRSGKLGRLPLATVLLAPWILWAGMAYLVRLRARSREDAATRRSRLAALALRQQLAQPDAVASEALAEYLGAKLDGSAASVVDLELAGRLEQAGVEVGLALRTQAMLRALLHEHFGQGQAQADTGELLALVEQLESAFGAQEGSG